MAFDWVASVVTGTGAVGAITATVLSILNYRNARIQESKTDILDSKVSEVHVTMNSRMDELIAITKQATEAEAMVRIAEERASGIKQLAEAQASAALELAQVKASSLLDVAAARLEDPPVPPPPKEVPPLNSSDRTIVDSSL